MHALDHTVNANALNSALRIALETRIAKSWYMMNPFKAYVPEFELGTDFFRCYKNYISEIERLNISNSTPINKFILITLE